MLDSITGRPAPLPNWVGALTEREIALIGLGIRIKTINDGEDEFSVLHHTATEHRMLRDGKTYLSDYQLEV